MKSGFFSKNMMKKNTISVSNDSIKQSTKSKKIEDQNAKIKKLNLNFESTIEKTNDSFDKALDVLEEKLKKHLKSDLYDKEILNLNQSVINDKISIINKKIKEIELKNNEALKEKENIKSLLPKDEEFLNKTINERNKIINDINDFEISFINDIKNLNNDYLFDLAYFVLSVISFKVISKTSKEKSQKQEMLDDLLVFSSNPNKFKNNLLEYKTFNIADNEEIKFIKKELDKINYNHELIMKNNKNVLNLFFDKLIKISQINLFLTISHQRKNKFQNNLNKLNQDIIKYKGDKEDLQQSLSILEKLNNIIITKEYTKNKTTIHDFFPELSVFPQIETLRKTKNNIKNSCRDLISEIDSNIN